MDIPPTTDIVFDEGEGVMNRSPYELTKKQIWYKCFQRCFDEGSKQMSNTYDQQGMTISQPEIFMNSVTMFQIMAVGTLMNKRYLDLFAKLSNLDTAALEKENESKEQSRRMITEANQNPDKRIDVNKNMILIDEKTKKEMVLIFREKLAVLSVLMEKEQYLDAQGGIKD